MKGEKRLKGGRERDREEKTGRLGLDGAASLSPFSFTTQLIDSQSCTVSCTQSCNWVTVEQWQWFWNSSVQWRFQNVVRRMSWYGSPNYLSYYTSPPNRNQPSPPLVKHPRLHTSAEDSRTAVQETDSENNLHELHCRDEPDICWDHAKMYLFTWL